MFNKGINFSLIYDLEPYLIVLIYSVIASANIMLERDGEADVSRAAFCFFAVWLWNKN